VTTVSTRQRKHYRRVRAGHPKQCAICKTLTREGRIRAKGAPPTGPSFVCVPCWDKLPVPEPKL
jgi:hypothetical protein